jgi:hypothetical protein
MAYKTKSYWLLPFISILCKSYSVNGKELVVRKWNGDEEAIPLEGVSVEIDRGKWLNLLKNYIFGSGNIRLTGSALGGERVLLNIRNANTFKKALKGELKSNQKIEETKSSAIEKRNWSEDDLGNTEVFYPQIPKTIDRYLKSTNPSKYSDRNFIHRVQEGAFVDNEEIIANYGDITITSPFAGKITWLGAQSPGRYDWEVEDYKIECPESGEKRFFYSFAVIPVKEQEHNAKSVGVRYAFNNGNVWLDMKKQKGDSFYTIIDLLVYELKQPGNGIKLPSNLANDEEYKKKLMKYWSLINNGVPHTIER